MSGPALHAHDPHCTVMMPTIECHGPAKAPLTFAKNIHKLRSFSTTTVHCTHRTGDRSVGYLIASIPCGTLPLVLDSQNSSVTNPLRGSPLSGMWHMSNSKTYRDRASLHQALIASLCLCLSLHTQLLAQWSTDPTNNLIVGFGLLPEIASDSAGGCYITYEQNLAYPRRLIVERLNRCGYKPWGTSRRILGEFPEQYSAQLTEDGQGGVIVAYVDRWADSVLAWRVRVQRVDSSGYFLWGPTGVRVSLLEINHGNHAVVSDGAGGCIVAWSGADTISYEYHLRISRVNSAGARVWGDSGRFVWNYGVQAPAKPQLIADGRGGCTLLFGVSRAQRFDPSGMPLWDSSGAQLENLATSKLTCDGSGGVILVGMKYISYNNGDPLWAAKAQRVDSIGHVLWGSNGLSLEDSLHGLFLNPPAITLARNAERSAAIAWGKRTSPSVLELRTQTVRPNGSVVFGNPGILVSRVNSSKGIVGVLPSDSSTSVFVWGDSRSPGGIYAQRLDTVGQVLWDTNDVPLNIPQFGEMKVATNGNGGCIGVGFHQFDFSIRALQVSRNGLLGQVITSIEHDISYDVPDELILYQNYPNPFNPQTIIRFQLPRAEPISLTLHNILGQRVKTLDSGIRTAGAHLVILVAEDLPSGTYFYRLTTPSTVRTHKLLMIK